MSVANFSRWAPGSLLAKRPFSNSQSSLGSVSSDPIRGNSIASSSIASSSITNGLASSGSSGKVADFGTLIIVVMKAKNLYNRRAISKQNPYCSVRVAKHSDRTKAITRGGQAPLWDHETRFRLSREDDNRELKLCVFDQNGSSTEIIGDAVIPLQPAFVAPPDAGYDGWFPIHFNKRYVGEVYLEMTFYPARRGSKRNSTSSLASASRSSFATPRSTTPRSSVSSSASADPAAAAAVPRPPSHNSGRLPMRHSGSMPALYDASSIDLSRTATPPIPADRRGSRPLPQVPVVPSSSATTTNPMALPTQEDIQRQINDGYEASLFERLKPSASQPF